MQGRPRPATILVAENPGERLPTTYWYRIPMVSFDFWNPPTQEKGRFS